MTRSQTANPRHRLAQEQGTIVKDWGGKLPIALIYPNSYYLGMSNLGIQAIYSILNNQADIVCERVFWDHGKGEEGPPKAVESQRPLPDFAVLAFSITYELDYFNVPKILKSAGLPLYATDRDESTPLIVAGGACITANPMPVAPFFDALCIGEAEAILPDLLLILRSGIENRQELLTALSRLPGIYVPQVAQRTVRRQWANDLDTNPVHSEVLTRNTELGDLYLIEVERGCYWGCRFCLVCGAFRPPRARSLDSLLEQAKIGLRYRRRLGLVGPDVADHPQFETLLERLKGMGAKISISSLRMKPLSNLALGELARGGTGTVAFAPEAGTERLRRVIRKGVTEDDVLNAIEAASHHDIKQLRLYFMIGLPTETEADIQGIVDLSLKCKAILEKHQSATRLVLSIAPFVPKAGTPFQWMPMESLDVLKGRLLHLKNELEAKGVKIKGESPPWSEVQTVLARGNEDLAAVLAGIQEPNLAGWSEAIRATGVNAESYAHERWTERHELPWKFIDSGIATEQLRRDMDAASSVA